MKISAVIELVTMAIETEKDEVENQPTRTAHQTLKKKLFMLIKILTSGRKYKKKKKKKKKKIGKSVNTLIKVGLAFENPFPFVGHAVTPGELLVDL
jgi:hypothetical protein